MHDSAEKKEPLFLYLVLFTLVFIAFELSVFLRTYGSYINDINVISTDIHLPQSSILAITFFVFAEVLVHLGFCICIYVISKWLIRWFGITRKDQFIFTLKIWTVGITSILLTNQYYYPNSQFALLGTLFPHKSTPTPFHIDQGDLSFKGVAQKPNVIIIGIDSLRPDFLSYFGAPKPTPHFDAFLASATIFSEALTPLARTFPSWVSILTSAYPKDIQVRTNLAPADRINFNLSMAKLFQQQGYDTIYATDETRFSNIDQRFGFDTIVSPPMGINDFLLGSFNDFPLSNLLVNSFLGQWLFPYSYANRAAFVTYDPNSFLKLIQTYLKNRMTKPLFMAVHFCLPHFPYLWANLSAKDYSPVDRYPFAIERVDQQVSDFIQVLKAQQLLEHAIVILLSDHGEALELAGDRITDISFYDGHQRPTRFYPPSMEKENYNQSAGHGTDVLGLSQYHTLLAFRLYGLGDMQSKMVSGMVSTLDIKPTLLELLKLKSDATTTGVSLASAIERDEPIQSHSDIFLESDYSPVAMRSVFPEVHKVLLDGVQLFKLNTLSRLVVKPEMEERIIASKQYADIHGDWILAIYPQANHDSKTILVNLLSGKWTDNLDTEFAKNSPAKLMLTNLKNFYGDEIKVNSLA